MPFFPPKAPLLPLPHQNSLDHASVNNVGLKQFVFLGISNCMVTLTFFAWCKPEVIPRQVQQPITWPRDDFMVHGVNGWGQGSTRITSSSAATSPFFFKVSDDAPFFFPGHRFLVFMLCVCSLFEHCSRAFSWDRKPVGFATNCFIGSTISSCSTI